jgi:hypothetical protein
MSNAETPKRGWRQQATLRFCAGFVGVISAAGLLLASIGVRLIALSPQRTRELGIRSSAAQ